MNVLKLILLTAAFWLSASSFAAGESNPPPPDFARAIRDGNSFNLRNMVRDGTIAALPVGLLRRAWAPKSFMFAGDRRFTAADDLSSEFSFDVLVTGLIPGVGHVRAVGAILYDPYGEPMANVAIRRLEAVQPDPGQMSSLIVGRLREASASIRLARTTEENERLTERETPSARTHWIRFFGISPASPRTSIIYLNARSWGPKSFALNVDSDRPDLEQWLATGDDGRNVASLQTMFAAAFGVPGIEAAVIRYEGGRITLGAAGRTILVEDEFAGVEKFALSLPGSAPTCAGFAQ